MITQADIDKEKMAEFAIGKFDLWRKDWVLFARDAFGVKLDAEQEEILRAVQREKRVSVRSGTARGKDFIAAVAALCFFYLTPRWDKENNLVSNTKVALTAPTDRQVRNIMMPEITRLFKRSKKMGCDLPGRLNAYDIRTDFAEWFLTGFKADENNQEAWSGFHAVNTMFVVTEASGISDDTFAAIEGNLQGNSRILIVFNPNINIGYAAQSQKSPRWVKFCLNDLTAPNVTERKLIIPGQVDYEWVKDKVDNWCNKIEEEDVRPDMDDFNFEGEWYRPSDLCRIKVLGQFPQVDEGSLIPLRWIEIAQERWAKHGGLRNHNYPRIGIDVAGMGRDATVSCYRYENYVDKFDKHNSAGQADHMKISGKIIHDFRSATGVMAMIDTIGEGAGVYARCQEIMLSDPNLKNQGANLVSCKFSEGAKRKNGKPLTDKTGQYQFLNMRAYLFWCVRDWLDPSNDTGAMLPPGGTLAEEATEIQWSFRSDGKILIEPKEDIKRRLGYSTDEFDALANTFYPQELHRVSIFKIPTDYDEDADLY